MDAPDATPVPASRRASILRLLVGAAVLVAVGLAGIRPLLTPAAPGPDTGQGFSVARAQQDLAVVAAAPHPMGSEQQSAVEAHLVRELVAMGLRPTVAEQRVTMAPDAPRSVWTGVVRNVVARIEGVGPDADQAVLLAAHYDSVPASPGAGDNGAGVVSVLAAMRMLAQGPPPRHDVVAAFVDGEEHEMLGSLALTESAPWLREVRVVVNTEGIGNAGRVLPALTTPRNGWALQQYLDVVPRPIVHSAFTAPLNATGQGADLGRYQDVVPAGLELVVIGGLPAYHAGADTVAAMHPGTLLDYGTTVVELARHLSRTDLEAVQAPDLTAFTVVDGLTVSYPSTWALPLALVCIVAVVAVTWLAGRRGRVRLGRVLLAWLGLGLACAVGVTAGTALWLLARLVDPRLADALNGGVLDRTAHVLAVVVAGAAGMLLVLWPLRRRCSGLEVVAGALVGSGLVAVLLALTLPDAAYAVTWPVLAATAGFGVLSTRGRGPGSRWVTVVLAAVPGVLLLSPLVVLYSMLAARFELLLPVATPLPMVWVVLGLTLVLSLVCVDRVAIGWRPPVAAALVALALTGVGVVSSAASSGPRPDLLVYHVDADAKQARWVALPEKPDDYTGQVARTGWTPAQFESSPFHQPGQTVSAITVPVSHTGAEQTRPATVVVTSDTSTSAGREVTVDVTARPGTWALTVDARSTSGITGLAVGGRQVAGSTAGNPSSLRVADFSPGQPLQLTITGAPDAGLELTVASYRLGLAGSPAAQLTPRPTSLTTGVRELADAVLVSQVLSLPPRA